YFVLYVGYDVMQSLLSFPTRRSSDLASAARSEDTLWRGASRGRGPGADQAARDVRARNPCRGRRLLRGIGRAERRGRRGAGRCDAGRGESRRRREARASSARGGWSAQRRRPRGRAANRPLTQRRLRDHPRPGPRAGGRNRVIRLLPVVISAAVALAARPAPDPVLTIAQLQYGGGGDW